MKGIRYGLLALGAFLIAGSWAVASHGSVAAQQATRMAVLLDEYSIKPELSEVPAGEITFDIGNVGDDVHEMIVIRSDMDIAALPPSSVKGEVDEAAIGEYLGGWEDIQPGARAEGTLTLTPGRYILLCNLTRHYELGMVTTLQVN